MMGVSMLAVWMLNRVCVCVHACAHVHVAVPWFLNWWHSESCQFGWMYVCSQEEALVVIPSETNTLTKSFQNLFSVCCTCIPRLTSKPLRRTCRLLAMGDHLPFHFGIHVNMHVMHMCPCAWTQYLFVSFSFSLSVSLSHSLSLSTVSLSRLGSQVLGQLKVVLWSRLWAGLGCCCWIVRQWCVLNIMCDKNGLWLGSEWMHRWVCLIMELRVSGYCVSSSTVSRGSRVLAAIADLLCYAR